MVKSSINYPRLRRNLIHLQIQEDFHKILLHGISITQYYSLKSKLHASMELLRPAKLVVYPSIRGQQDKF